MTKNEDLNPFRAELLTHRQSLFRQAAGLTRNRADAEDLVSDVVVKVLQKPHLYTQGTNMGAWLSSIVRNTFTNSYHSKKAYDARLKRVFRERRPSDYEMSYGLDDDCTQALEDLPDVFAEVLHLHLEGYDNSEIASLLSIPYGTCLSRLKRAKDRMRESLAGFLQEPPSSPLCS